MSDYQVQSGFVMKLIQLVPQDQMEAVRDKLYETFPNMTLNYEGSLLFYAVNEIEAGDGIDFLHISSTNKLIKAMSDISLTSLQVDPSTVRWYSTCWYNGADSHMDEMTAAQFDRELAVPPVSMLPVSEPTPPQTP